jgi:hypothetical protein
VQIQYIVVLSFKKARTIAPLYTGGPVSITQNGLWLVTCVGEQALLTDLQHGTEICRFAGVPYYQYTQLCPHFLTPL